MNTRSLLLSLLILAGPAFGASVDGAEIHWTSTGSGDATLIFVHGWTCDESSWDEQVPYFSADYRVITLDLPGHGRSEQPAGGDYSMQNFARAVEAVRREAGVENAVLIGHSMGGPVVRQYALMYPDRVEALVSVDGLVLVPGPGNGDAPVPASMAGEEGRAAREAMVESMFSEATTEELRQKIREMMLGTPVATADGAMRATWDTSSWTAEPVDVPVLGVYADGSQLGANRAGMEQIYPKIEYHEIPGTGHFLMMEKPAAFNRILEQFLSSID